MFFLFTVQFHNKNSIEFEFFFGAKAGHFCRTSATDVREIAEFFKFRCTGGVVPLTVNQESMMSWDGEISPRSHAQE